MGANQSSTSEHKVAELLFERGTDAVAVEVHSAAVDSEAVTVFTYFTDSKHRNIATNAIQVSEEKVFNCSLLYYKSTLLYK